MKLELSLAAFEMELHAWREFGCACGDRESGEATVHGYFRCTRPNRYGSHLTPITVADRSERLKVEG